MELQKCRACGSLVAGSAKTCPQCGAKMSGVSSNTIVLGLAALLVVIGLYVILS